MTQAELPASEEEARRTRRMGSYGIVAALALVGIAFFGGIVLLVIVLGLFSVFWFLSRALWPYPYGYWERWDEDAASLLTESYARGEITEEEFDLMMQDLRQSGA